jgi:hypothetical protein
MVCIRLNISLTNKTPETNTTTKRLFDVIATKEKEKSCEQSQIYNNMADESHVGCTRNRESNKQQQQNAHEYGAMYIE